MDLVDKHSHAERQAREQFGGGSAHTRGSAGLIAIEPTCHDCVHRGSVFIAAAHVTSGGPGVDGRKYPSPVIPRGWVHGLMVIANLERESDDQTQCGLVHFGKAPRGESTETHGFG